jgi:hypothetical protein
MSADNLAISLSKRSSMQQQAIEKRCTKPVTKFKHFDLENLLMER